MTTRSGSVSTRVSVATGWLAVISSSIPFWLPRRATRLIVAVVADGICEDGACGDGFSGDGFSGDDVSGDGARGAVCGVRTIIGIGPGAADLTGIGLGRVALIGIGS